MKTPAADHRRPPATYCRPSWFKQCGFTVGNDRKYVGIDRQSLKFCEKVGQQVFQNKLSLKYYQNQLERTNHLPVRSCHASDACKKTAQGLQHTSLERKNVPLQFQPVSQPSPILQFAINKLTNLLLAFSCRGPAAGGEAPKCAAAWPCHA